MREGTHVAQLLILHSQVLPRVDDLFTLLLDDGLVLVPDHLLLFFEISDNLRQTLLKNLNFVLVGLDPIGLHGGSLCVLLLSTLVDRNISLDFTIRLPLATDLFLMLFELITLADRLKGEALVFIMNLTLDCLYSYSRNIIMSVT